MGQPNENAEVEVDNGGNPVDEAPTPGVDLDNGHDENEAGDEPDAEGESDADALDAEAPHDGE